MIKESMPMSELHWMHPPGPELRKLIAPEIIFGVGDLHFAGQYGRGLGGSEATPVLERKAENLHPARKGISNAR